MMVVSDLFDDPDLRRFAAAPETDPLTEEGGLDEAGLVSARLDMMTASAGLLIDLRGALGFRMPDVAVLVARDVDRLSWENDNARDRRFTFHTILGWYPATDRPHWGLTLRVLSVPDRPVTLTVRARSAGFYVGNVPGYPDRPPNIQEDTPEEVLAGFPRWNAEFTPTAATFIGPFPT